MFYFEYTHKFDCQHCNNAVVVAESMEEAIEKLDAHLEHLKGFKIISSLDERGDIILISSD
jgi:transcription initiation factor IIE alpha subunit